jgi:hypothetical protein
MGMRGKAEAAEALVWQAAPRGGIACNWLSSRDYTG